MLGGISFVVFLFGCNRRAAPLQVVLELGVVAD